MIQQQAQEFLRELEAKDWAGFRERFSTLPEDVAQEVSRLHYEKKRDAIAKYFVPEKTKFTGEHVSPSGRYFLKLFSVETGPKSWAYTQGLVFSKESDEPLFEVRRNYSSFPFSWIEDHPNGHAYLVCGEDYQGTTVLELDTGKRRNFFPMAGVKGHGFCWSSHSFHAESSTLVVTGCYWACPYEYRFYDFSNPMDGWPEIEIEDSYVDADARKPTFEPDGTIKCYESRELDDGEEDENGNYPTEVVAIKTFRREGLKLVLLNEWVSDAEQTRRVASELASKAFDEWVKTFKATDPLYLEMLRAVDQDKRFKTSEWLSIGQVYENWCPSYPVDTSDRERRICNRLVQGHNNITIDLEWGAATGPIKLVVYRDGKHAEDKFFMEHSADSMKAALTYAKELLS